MQTTETAYDEIVELFARGSGPTEILQFRPSATAQDRASYLLEQNRAGALTEDEAAELEQLGQLEHMVQLVKARARLPTRSGS
jgi:hypothetical protein